MITERRFSTARGDLERIAIDRYATLPRMRRACELRSTLTGYGAAPVALAEIRGCEDSSGDATLAKSQG